MLGDDIEQRILRARSNYHGMLRLIDDQFKRLVEGIEARGLRDNTIVIYISDHGDYVGEYGLIRKGVDLPDILTHVPLAMQGPGIKPQGLRDDVCVNTVDILPTICRILGVETPIGVQGKSILPILTGADYPAHEYDIAYSESGFSGLYWDNKDGLSLAAEGACDESLSRFDCLNTWTQCGQVRMVRKGDWKIQSDMLGTTYLYNLREDPYELRNLANDPACAEIKSEMLTELVAAILKAQDPLPLPHYRYRLKVHPEGFWTDENYHTEDMGVIDQPVIGNHSC